MATDNPMPIGTKVMCEIMGCGTIIGFIIAEKGIGWKYHISFTGLESLPGLWLHSESVRKANWLEVLLYG